MTNAQMLEQLLGMRQQLRNLAVQITFLIEELQGESIRQQVENTQNGPRRFGQPSDVLGTKPDQIEEVNNVGS